jgi:hypothetical protein
MKPCVVAIGFALLAGAVLAAETKPTGLIYQGKPALDVPLAEVAPAVDGRLDDAAWAKAAPLTVKDLNSGERGLLHRTEARLLATRDALFIGVRCFDSDLAHVVATVTNRDGAVWADDDVEIYLTPGEDPNLPYAQFAINPRGTLLDSYNVTDGIMPAKVESTWNAEGVQVATGVEADAWTLELKIPFAALKLSADPGKLAHGWRFDLFRTRQGRENEDIEESAWVPTCEKTSQVPSAFGYLFLEPFGGHCPPSLAANAVAPLAFTQKPTVTRVGDRVRIAFSVNRTTDVAVAIENAKGEVVRHLAAGVLGPNAPAPLRPGLSQEVEWDGKDDAGHQVSGARHQTPAEATATPDASASGQTPAASLAPDARGLAPAFSVRVSLHLQPTFQKLIGSDPSDIGVVKGLACGPGGELFVFHSYGYQHPGDASTACAVFGRDGRYRRTISPYPAGLPDDKLMGVKRLTREDGEKVPFIYHIETRAHLPGLGDLPAQRPVVTRDGRLAFLGLRERLEYAARAGDPWVTVIHTDGSVPTRGVLFTRLQPFLNRGACLALAPDEKTFYATGMWMGSAIDARRGQVSEWPLNAVYRFTWEERQARVFLGTPEKRGDGAAEFNAPQGIAVDGSGNVYVADRGNGRISVFKPDGTPLARIPVRKPQRVEVHRKTGAIYVVSGESAVELIKLDGLAGRVVARQKLPAPGLLALDDSQDPPRLWFSPAMDDRAAHLESFEDRGEQFAGCITLGRYTAYAKHVKPPPDSAAVVHSLSLDRRNGWLYIGNFWRYRVSDGTWEQLPQPRGAVREWPESEPSSTIGNAGLDGNYYMNLGYNSPLLLRYDAERKLLPFETPTRVPFRTSHGATVTTNEFPAIGGFQLCHGQGQTADAAGNVYVIWQKTPREPGDGWRAAALYVYDSKGRCIREKLINSSFQGLFGVRVDPAGNLYLALGLRQGKHELPDGLLGQVPERREDPEADAGMNGYPLIYGSIAKFTPAGGRIGEGIGGVACRYGNERAIEVQGAQWIVSEASPVISWNMPKGAPGTLNICTCDPYFFDVDGFGRSFFADAARCRVGVLDTGGNLIRWFGTYGNADSSTGAVPGEIGFCWPQSVAVGDQAAYVSDRLNRRIVAVNLEYAATATAEIAGGAAR